MPRSMHFDKRRRVRWSMLDDAARRLLNDMLTVPGYRGGLQNTATGNKVIELGLVTRRFDRHMDRELPREVLTLTPKGKKLVDDPEYRAWLENPMFDRPGAGKRRQAPLSVLVASVNKLVR
jgi:hypothetical protein